MARNEPPFAISYVAAMVFHLSTMLDSGKHDDISIEEVKEHIYAGDLIRFLNERAKQKGGTFDNGFSDMFPAFTAWYVAQLQEHCEATDGRERRKYGIQFRGLCLLISYAAEIIQSSKDIRLGEF